MNDKKKKEWLLGLAKKMYNEGDSYYAAKTNKGDKWIFGYSNDSEMRHGNGEEWVMPDEMINILAN